MKANKKFVDGDEAVSAVIGVILMVAITVAIAATVYVYVTGMVGQSGQQAENAGVTAKHENGRVKITLASAGPNYDDGYETTDVTIFADDEELAPQNTWVVGEVIFIGISGVTYAVGGGTITGGTDVSIVVSILDTVVYDGSIHIT